MHRLRTAFVLAFFALTAASPGHAQPAARAAASTFELSVANIMRGPEHVGSPPTAIRWTDDSRWIYFRWKPGGRPWHEEPALYRVPASGGTPERLSDEAADSLGVLLATGDISPDERWRVVAYEGDLWLIDRRSLAVRRLTHTRTAESNPVFGHDGRTIYFVQENNVFSMSLDGGSVRQLTDIRAGSPPEERQAAGQRRFLEEQQKELFEHIRREVERRDEMRRRREAREARNVKTVYISPEERVQAIAPEPGGRYAVLHVYKPARDARRTIVPDYVTASGYTENVDARAKVGDAQSEARLGLVDLSTGDVRWLELGTATAASQPADSTTRARSAKPRLAAARFLGWNRDGTLGLIGAVSYDFKDQWLHVLDAATGEVRIVAHDHDDAWIGGPCADWTDFGCAGWMPDGKSIYFLSERDGYSHLYTVAATGGEARQLTRGQWEVKSVSISPDRRYFYLTTSEGSPFEEHFWRAELDGSRRTRITTRPGFHDVTVSPDGRRLAIVHSYSNRPPELFVAENRPGAEMRRVTVSPTEEWSSFGWIDPEIVWFEARDGVKVPARIYRPRDLGAEPHGGAVIFVHGAGYLHNVHKGWSTYYREYMFHHLLAARGFTVLDIDYRGSAGYGRDWRTAIYRHMGGKDLSDQVDGARYLVQHEGVDPERIGIYGGSYGGFITLMALFTEAKTFAAGAALRAVTDWAHYNHWYTQRILNLPHEDTLAYRRSSPIYFAEGLEDPLLIAHGMVDTNVHFQDVVRLAQRLIELGKTNWEMAIYPVEDHGFVEPSSWTDQYRRILELFERHLTRPRTASQE
ncbi:MAG: prolyl oligopeptidase family serine peptidase [bacterium]|nr:MAG: S9 family peptidase [bacterium]